MKIHLNRKLPIRIIFFLYFVYFVMSYMGGEWTFSNSKYGMMPIYTHTVNNLRLIYLLFILILGLYELLLQFKQKNISQIDMILFVVFLFASCIHLYTVSKLTDTQTLLFQSGTPMMYLVFLTYFVGMDDKVEELLQKTAKEYGLVFLAFTMIYFLIFCMDVGYSFGVKFSSGPILYSFNNGFFLIVYALNQEKNFKRRLYWKITLPLCLITSFITNSRSWVVQTIVLFMMYYIIQRRATYIIRNVLKTVGVVFLVLVVINLFASDLVGSLIARLGESTRSSQLETFFEQIPLSSLISGLGYNASYRFLMWSNYQYIDNQVIFSCFRYGVLVTALFLYFLIKPIVVAIQCGRETFFRAVGILHFVFAMLGLAVYFSLSIDMWCIVSYMLAGRTYANTRKDNRKRVNDRRYGESR